MIGSKPGGGRDTLLALVEDVTPERAAAALSDGTVLSAEQLDAPDRLGNGSGSYDLGDLIAWLERCRSGEAGCGGAGPASDAGSPTTPPPVAPPPQSGSQGRSRGVKGSTTKRGETPEETRGQVDPPHGGTDARVQRQGRWRDQSPLRLRGYMDGPASLASIPPPTALREAR